MKLLPSTRVRERKQRKTTNRSMLRAHFRSVMAERPTRNAVGLKRWFVPGSEFEGGGERTLYAAKELRRRRAANAVAKQARKVNRG